MATPPLNYSIRITDTEGRPTPEFILWWQSLRDVSAGGGGGYFAGATGSAGGASTATAATKGLVFTPSQTITVTHVTAYIDAADATTELYVCGVAEVVSAATGEIVSVLADSGAGVATGSTNMTALRVALTSPVVLTVGTPYLVYTSVVSGTDTTAARVGAFTPSTTAMWNLNAPGVTHSVTPRYSTIALSPGQLPDASGDGWFNVALEGNI